MLDLFTAAPGEINIDTTWQLSFSVYRSLSDFEVYVGPYNQQIDDFVVVSASSANVKWAKVVNA